MAKTSYNNTEKTQKKNLFFSEQSLFLSLTLVKIDASFARKKSLEGGRTACAFSSTRFCGG
jgi:hypothetical protein